MKTLTLESEELLSQTLTVHPVKIIQHNDNKTIKGILMLSNNISKSLRCGKGQYAFSYKAKLSYNY